MLTPLPHIRPSETVILANGAFPSHEVPRRILHFAKRVICCDGAIENLLKNGIEPAAIVGDLDSISDEHRVRFSGILHQDGDQEINDLTKAVSFCRGKNWGGVSILGATGKREDHTLGNMSLLVDYINESFDIQMITDHGVINAIKFSSVFESFAGQQVSFFRCSKAMDVTTENLKYPLQKSPLAALWMGTLNEAMGASFALHFTKGSLLVFREHR
ncbi:MAG: thiamine diphosphokinase [Prevotellaceae bacterium]|jgi:thiamine pyrophosphokinase|nr:thiamine diphosphokinase [Prevotellaceae bacterium]